MLKYLYILLFIVVVFFGSCKITKPTNKNLNVKNFSNEKLKLHLSEALREMLYENYEEATIHLNKCLEYDDKNSAVFYKFSELFSKNGDYNIAINYMQKAEEYSPNNMHYKYSLAKLYVKNYQVEEAIPLLEEVILVTKGYVPFYELAHYYKYLNKYPEAINTYNKLQEKEGVTIFNSNQKLAVYKSYKNEEEYIKELVFLVDYFPYSLEYNVELFDYYITNNMIDKANIIFESIKEKRMETGEIYLSFAKFYKEKNNYDSTYYCLKPAFRSEISVNSKLSAFNDEEFYSSKNYINSEVDTLYNLLINSNPDNYETYLQYSKYLTKNHKLYHATNVLELYKVEDYNFQLNEMLIFLYIATEKTEKLDSLTTLLTDLYPNMSDFFLYAGISKILLQDYEKSEKLLLTGLDLIYNQEDLSSQFNFYLSYLYFVKNDEQKFEEHYKIAIQKANQYFYLQNEYSLFFLKKDIHSDKANVLINTCVTAMPDKNDYQYTLIFYYYKIKDYELALYKIKELIEKSEIKIPKYYELYGDILYAQNKTKEAKMQWKIAFELDKYNYNLKEKI